jgi:large subunit ribosomal protein L24
MAAKIKKGDRVVILTGKDKGKSGAVTRVLPKEERVVVSGLNMVQRHTKPTQADPQGGIKHKEAPLHVSNVALVDSKGKPTRVGFRMEGETKVRFAGQDRPEHGHRRSRGGLQEGRRRDEGPGRDRRPEAHRDQGPQLGRPVQDP